MHSKPKIFIFYTVLFLPLALLSICVISLGYRIYGINHIDQREMVKIGHEVINRERRTRALTQIQSANDKYLIYVFGGSSVVLPDSCDGRLELDNVFSELLARRFTQIDGKQVEITNLGHCGMDSSDVLYAMKRSLQVAKPNLIIVYSGHNDYNNFYHHSLIVNKISISNYLYLTDLMVGLNLHQLIYHDQDNPKWSMQWFFRTSIEPPLQQMFQTLKLVSYNQGYFDEYDQMILDKYTENIHNILQLSAHQKIPVILMTPISNLEAPPIGIDQGATRLHEKGMKETEYEKRIDYLNAAKDMEYLSPDTRAKTNINDFIRSLKAKNLCVVDVEKEFRKKKFMFGHNEFPDYFHFSNETHQKIAELLEDAVEKCG